MHSMTSRKGMDLSMLGIISLLAFAVWVVPITRPLGLPLMFLNTHIHELCHALAALATSGQVAYIKVFADGSGVTPVMGGNLPLLAMAGYVGSALVGGLLIAASKNADHARKAMWTLTAALGISNLLFVRGEMLGWMAGVFWVAVGALSASKLSEQGIKWFTAFIGVQQCLTSVHALLVLYRISSVTEQQSDAMLMQRASGIPAVVWACIWMILSALCMGWGVRQALRTR